MASSAAWIVASASATGPPKGWIVSNLVPECVYIVIGDDRTGVDPVGVTGLVEQLRQRRTQGVGVLGEQHRLRTERPGLRVARVPRHHARGERVGEEVTPSQRHGRLTRIGEPDDRVALGLVLA